jgi:hypothetical protein
MRAAIILALVLAAIPGIVSAYELSIFAPAQVQRGLPLVVNGTSNLPAGISVDIVLSRSEYTVEEVARQTVTLQGTKEFVAVFDTKGLTKGQYKVEVPGIQGYSFLGGSVTLRVVEIIDRTDEITIISPSTQEMDNALDIRGYIRNLKNAGVQVQVTGPDNSVIFGPEYISTGNDGSFSRKLTVTMPGNYDVSFTDARGYIGTISFTVRPKVVATTVQTTAPPVRTTVTAVARASNDKPAYFAVTGKGTIRVSTSTGIDWVIEYRDPEGVIQKVNIKGQLDPEEVTVEGTGGTINFKVYPYKFSDQGEVTLSAEGADTIAVISSVPPEFASTATPTQKSPVSMVVVIAALMVLVLKRAWR